MERRVRITNRESVWGQSRLSEIQRRLWTGFSASKGNRLACLQARIRLWDSPILRVRNRLANLLANSCALTAPKLLTRWISGQLLLRASRCQNTHDSRLVSWPIYQL